MMRAAIVVVTACGSRAPVEQRPAPAPAPSVPVVAPPDATVVDAPPPKRALDLDHPELGGGPGFAMDLLYNWMNEYLPECLGATTARGNYFVEVAPDGTIKRMKLVDDDREACIEDRLRFMKLRPNPKPYRLSGTFLYE